MQFSTISGILNAPGVPDQESYTFRPVVWKTRDTQWLLHQQHLALPCFPLDTDSQRLCSIHDASQWCFLWDVPPCFAPASRPLLLWFSSCPPVIFIFSSSQNTILTVSVLEFICCSKQHPVCLISIISLFLRSLRNLHWSLPPRILLPTHSHFYCLLDALSFLVLDFSASIVLSVVLPPWLPLSFPQCLPFNCFQQGGSELLSAPSLEKHYSL